MNLRKIDELSEDESDSSGLNTTKDLQSMMGGTKSEAVSREKSRDTQATVSIETLQKNCL